MERTSVPSFVRPASAEVLDALADELERMTPELRKAAAYVLERPNDVSVSSIRQIADAAEVKPNTLVRLARSIGFDGYEDFRAPFREEIRRGPVNFPDRVRWLQSLGQSGELGELYRDTLSAVIGNVEETFAGIDEASLTAAARTVWESRQVFTLGVGVNGTNARNFTYLASTGMTRFHAIPRSGGTPIDDLAWADERDVLIAITCKPYRSEVVEAVRVAREQGVRIVGISDSPASPIVAGSEHGFVVATDSPQFFPSSVATIALLETLLSFVIAVATPNVVERVKRFHDRRHQLGLYAEEP